MSQTVLVTGASGFIAQQLIIDLLEQGHKVRGTIRSLSKADTLKKTLAEHSNHIDNLELVEADLESDKGWPEAMQGIDVVQHLASPFPMASPKNPDDLIRPAREGSLRVLRAAKAAGVNRVILTSSFASVGYGWGDALPEMTTEKDWTNTDNAKDCTTYVASKTLAEKAAWDYVNGEGKGIQLTTILPVAVFGPIRSAQVKTSVSVVSQMLAGKLPMLPNVGFQVVDVRDVCAAHIAAMNNPETIGERYILADEFTDMQGFAHILKEGFPDLASRIATRRMPNWLVRFGALFNGELKTMTLELNKRRQGSSQKVRALLGRELISSKEAILASGETLIKYKAV
ncbi:aldehyde reductase [Spongiibacter sp. KMU-158]|uniref:Aldehyde reductase n=1 Tax=Spongiibacter pelagi TaxID=2760804 RepID=A0A927GVY0_9GAMM|nr:aldehyde reductase [Spongiibacter pelagi]MBD2858875.1 aldehyde reductase [Spongiibacter pelagi]